MQNDNKEAIYLHSSSSWWADIRTELWTKVTYPSTGHDMWSLAALPSRPLPPHLSCYTSQGDLTPWLDNSPFFELCFLSKTVTRKSSFHPATGPSPCLNHREELGLVQLSFCLETIKSIAETSILSRKLFKSSQSHFVVQGFPGFFLLQVK